MLKKMLILNLFCAFTLLGMDAGYYNEENVGDQKIYFPKSDTEYIDYLTKRTDADSYYELAMAHLKLGRDNIAERYMDLYKKEASDPEKLIRYYRLSKNYPELEKAVDTLIATSDDEDRTKFKILVDEQIRQKNIPMDADKYFVGKVEKLFYYRNDDEKFREYFNSEKWTRHEMNDYVKKVSMSSEKNSAAAEKIFDMFATERDRLRREYLKIGRLSDIEGYKRYYSYAEKNSISPEIRSEAEEVYYLKYKGKELEADQRARELAALYIEEKDYPKAQELFAIYEGEELLNFLMDTNEREAYKAFMGGKNYDLGIRYLSKYPAGKGAEEVYTITFMNASDEEKAQLIQRYDKGYAISKEYTLGTMSVEERETFYRKEIAKGNLRYMSEYAQILKGKDSQTAEEEVKNISREAYVGYLVETGKPVSEENKIYVAGYLYDKGSLRELQTYAGYLYKDELKELAGRDTYFRDYYRNKYPLEKENIDLDQARYFYFDDKPNTDKWIVERLGEKRHLEPQERYYLAKYYHDQGDYVKSFRESEKIFRRYQLSDRIFNLHSENIKQIKKESAN